MSISFHQGLPEFEKRKAVPYLIILGDLLNDVYSTDLCDIFTKGGHHRNVSVILIIQNLFHQGRCSRDISLDAKYLVIYKNVRDKNQFAYLVRQVYPENSNSPCDYYLEATH